MPGDGGPHGPDPQPPSRLARRLGLGEAVAIGLGSMIGAGVFSAFGPAAAAAGSGMLAGLVLAGAVAYLNASASARLAAVHPEAGGTYAYGRRRLGDVWGFLAGGGFVAGKTASCAAMAITFGSYAVPRYPGPAAAGAVLAMTAVTVRRVERTARVSRAMLAVVGVSLASVVVASLLGGHAHVSEALRWVPVRPARVLRAAGILFFAFAGYARIATLGEEVADPARVIPRAIRLALGIALVAYAVVAMSALAALGPRGLAGAEAPLAAAVQAGSLVWLVPLVRVGAAAGSLGALLSLLAGVGRTVFAMAAAGDLPRVLGAVGPRHRVPHRAQIAVAGVVVAVVAAGGAGGLGAAIGFSSFTVLCYYAVTNAAAWTLGGAGRRGRVGAALGITGCLGLAFSLGAASVWAGMGVLAVGALGWSVGRRRQAARDRRMT
ncbi:MAG TPA: APC family permease [Actinomycetota bacterium]